MILLPDVKHFLKVMVERKASDLFITAQFPPSAKIDGEVTPLSETPYTDVQSLAFVESLMSDKQKTEFHTTKECNFAFSDESLGRFRVSAFWQRDEAGCVMRRIETKIPTPESLLLPEVLKELIMVKRGLIIFVGGTGTGKSTSLAALIGHRNHNSKGHILTIEDPIEYVHQHAKSIITQREVGLDTESFGAALKSSLRQAPDVILIGEIRSQETMEFALSFAETGHLCVATLHANNANQALDRIMHLVPESMHRQLLFDLSLNLKAVVAQQLVPKADGTGRRAAIEILINTSRISDIIQKNELHLLKEQMASSQEQGLQTFDQALFQLFKEGQITYDNALHYADSQNDLRLMIKLNKLGPDSDKSSLSNLSYDITD